MRQTALIYLHVTARLQRINCFKRLTSHELNFNTGFQFPSPLRAVKYNFNILDNSQMQCSRVIQTQAQKCDGMHINFRCRLPRRQQVCTRNQQNPNSTYRPIFSDERNPPFWCADAQFILLRILRSSKYIKNIYIKLIYVFVSCHLKIGVLIKAGPQSLFPAEPGVKNG